MLSATQTEGAIIVKSSDLASRTITKSFDSKQRKLIAQGDLLTSQLKMYVKKALGVGEEAVAGKRHTYIYSKPGAGKTFTVEQTAKEYGVELVKVQGTSSLSAFSNQIAHAAWHFEGCEIVVWIDDCDALFTSPEALGVMKGVLDEDRNVLSWNKNLTVQINTLEKGSEIQQDIARALRAAQPAGSVGIEVPTDRMRFIVTSNKELTNPNATLNTQKKMDEAAIRDRVSYVPFNLTDGDSWGWLASVVTKTDTLQLSKHQTKQLLSWMYDNWTKLSGVSMRTVKDLAALMHNHPRNYIDYWTLQYLEK